MRGALFVTFALAACGSPENSDDFPIEPGGGGGRGGTGMTRDGGLDAIAGDAGDGGVAMLDGRVCLVADLRQLASCAATGAGGLTVRLGTQTTTTADSGTFAIATPQGTNLRWRVTAAGVIITSVMDYGPAATIPAIRADDYLALQTANGVIAQDGQGSLVARIARSSGGVVSGATVVATPVPTYGTLYDGTTAATWEQGATGSYGIAWLNGMPAGPSTITVNPPAAEPAVSDTVVIEDQAITFAVIAVP